MHIATILPAANLNLEAESEYHLCLAHLLSNRVYRKFFWKKAKEGKYVIMDNGVVETGFPKDIEKLFNLARSIGVNEMILPDMLYNTESTLNLGKNALKFASTRHDFSCNFMAVPQGKTQEKWAACVREMLTWPVKCIGISRFLVPTVFESRKKALEAVPELINSDKEIHLLGCPNDPAEIAEANLAFPGRIRGTDSGVAAMFTQVNLRMGECDKPKVDLEFFDSDLDQDLLEENVTWWKNRCLKGADNE